MLGGSVGLVLVAAGYGSVRAHKGAPIPKVLEDIGGVPMFLRAVMAAEEARMERVTVVVNPSSAQAIRDAAMQAWRAGLIDRLPTFAVQDERRGSADAVMCALPGMDDECFDKVVIAYGDMPLWSAETMLELLAHSESSDAAMVTVRRQSKLPGLNRHGRVLRDAAGDICRVVEEAAASPEEKRLTIVNPSLWMWPVRWLQGHIPLVPAHERTDGFGPEYHLPHLVDMAARQFRIAEVAIPDKRAYEALGVNTLRDLRKIRSFFA